MDGYLCSSFVPSLSGKGSFTSFTLSFHYTVITSIFLGWQQWRVSEMWCVKLIFKDLRSDSLSVTHVFVPEQYGIICNTASNIVGTRWLWVMYHIPIPLSTEKSPANTFHRRLGGSWSRAGSFGGRKCLICFIFWDSNVVSSFIQPVVSFLDRPGSSVFVLNYRWWIARQELRIKESQPLYTNSYKLWDTNNNKHKTP